MIAVTIITFLLLAATGNQAARLAGKNATAAQIHQISVQYGLDKPIYVQYVKTMKNIFTGKAYSYTQNINVLQEVKPRLPANALAGVRRRDHLAHDLDPGRHVRGGLRRP